MADTHKEDEDTYCIVVSILENSKKTSIELDTVQNFMIPFLLGTVIKGLLCTNLYVFSFLVNCRQCLCLWEIFIVDKNMALNSLVSCLRF